MAVEPIERRRTRTRARLEPFDATHAELIASWVRDAREAFWLAPRTPAPLTGEKVRGWVASGCEALMLMDGRGTKPVAYGELNVMASRRKEYWLGHLIVDPRKRGGGLGVRLTRLLLERAFLRYVARRVSLVVFPENETAIRCYTKAGLHAEGFETHHFPKPRRSEQLLLMATRHLP